MYDSERPAYAHARRSGRPCQHATHRLTYAQYDVLRVRAGDACELCGTPDQETPRGELVIDHFEGGGAFFVRGLLCDRCNSVMARHDSTMPWDPASLPFKDKARAYHLNAVGEPGPEALRRAEAEIARRFDNAYWRYRERAADVRAAAQ
ncbi:endonuclease domain-containing protein [Kitasatospora sp. NPDC101447]|uniref:endonuclease domain-containing protein n=1 Tax=Kitasatospora sp. NPDC101447 TaxID=3364102 RepID=UPI0037F9F3F3